MSQNSILAQLLETVRKVEAELTYVEDGKDSGLLPINSFLNDLEDALRGDAGVPEDFATAVRFARQWIDRVFDTTATFDGGTIANFREWVAWMVGALEGHGNGGAVPSLPQKWEEGGVPPESVASRILKLTQDVAKEIASAEDGKDNGLLPVNSFIYEIEELMEQCDFPTAIDEAVHQARKWLDQILDSTAVFDAQALERFSDWAAWMDAALEQNEKGNRLPDNPASWGGGPEDSGDSGEKAEPRIAGLAQQIELELAFAEVGKDTGLLPINSFICEMEEAAKAPSLNSAIREAVGFGRRWMDRVFDTTAQFDQITLDRLGEWTSWMDAAVERVLSGNQTPEFPKAWSEAATSESAAQAPSSAPAPVPVVVNEPAASAKEAPVAVVREEPAAAFGEEPVLTLNLDGDDRDLIVGFVSESYEHLQNIEQGVLVLEDNPTDAGTLNSIFRAFHTFKGGAGCCNLTCIKDLAHELESVLDAARQQKLQITTDTINVILEGGDTLGKFVTLINDRLGGKDLDVPIQIPTLNLIARAKHILGTGPVPAASSAPAPVAAQPAKAPDSAAAPVQNAPSASSGAPAGGGHASGGADAAHPAHEKKAAGPSKAVNSGPAGGAAGFVKVDTYKLDALIDLVGELVISESMVVQDPELRNVPSRNLVRNLGQLHRITSELQRTAMSLRMVPIRATFQKMNRLVRDLGAKQNKQVQLILSGEDTELDRNIVEEISDPLVHMIRNATDHGVEKPEARVAKGKPPTGTVHLRAFHQGGNIVIQIQDDGNGLNKEKLLSKARERGLVKPNESLSDKEIYDLIFAPGFSTAEVVSDISGRGVGMDVVRQNIEKLRGKVDIDTVPGQGTTFTIYLPLTLAIIDGMIVSVGSERYIIPTLSVRESFRPRPEMISSVHERGEMVNVRGRLCPLLRLYQHLEQKPKITNPAEAIVVVVESGSQTRCLMVDELLGKQEVVIKTLGGAMKKNHALAGGAVLGDGRVGLILNVDAFVKLSGNNGG